jgi:hypothetical protein
MQVHGTERIHQSAQEIVPERKQAAWKGGLPVRLE